MTKAAATGEAPKRTRSHRKPAAPPPVATGGETTATGQQSAAASLSSPPPGTQVKVHQTERREFTEIAGSQPAASAAAQAAADAAAADLAELVDYEAHPIDRFLQQIEGDTTEYRLGVKRLPDPIEMKGKFRNPTSIEIMHGDMTFDPDNFLNTIRDTLGGGKYRLSLRRNGGTFVTRPMEMIIADPPYQPGAQQQGTAYNTPNGQQPQQPTDVITQLTAQFSAMDKLRKVMFPNLDQQGQQQQQTTPETDPQLQVAKVMLQSPEVAKQVVGNLMNFGKDASDKQPWYGKLIEKGIEQPGVAELLVHGGLGMISSVLSFLNRGKPQANAQAPGEQPAPQSEQTYAPQGQQAYNSTTEGAPQVADDQQDEPTHFMISDYLVEQMRQGAEVTADAPWLVELREKWPMPVAQAESIIRVLSVPQIKLVITGIDVSYSDALNEPGADKFLTDLKAVVSAPKEKTE